jgi:hypothetical protein
MTFRTEEEDYKSTKHQMLKCLGDKPSQIKAYRWDTAYITPELKNMIAQMCQHCIKNPLTKTIDLAYRTTMFSRTCIVIMKLIDKWGNLVTGKQWSF